MPFRFALSAVLAALCLLALPLRLLAQNWERDPTFTPPVLEQVGSATTGTPGIAPLADGRLLVAKSGSFANGQRTPALLRVNADGSIDPTFATPSLTGSVSIVLVYPDGRALVTDGSRRLHRLLASGAADPTFAVMALEAEAGLTAALTPSGGIWIWGLFNVAGDRANLALLKADGGWDERFPPLNSGKVQINDALAHADESLIIAGTSSLTRARLFRLKPSGALDASFDASATFPGTTAATPTIVTRQADGSLVAADGSRVWRILPSGALDTAYRATFTLTPRGMGRASADGPLYYYAVLRADTVVLRRLALDGSTDATFSLEGSSNLSEVAGAYPRTADGQTLYIANPMTFARSGAHQLITRTDATGAIDARFDLRLSSRVQYLDQPVRQPDGKYLISGSFDYAAGVALARNRANVVRLNRDGSLDRTFQAPGLMIEGDSEAVIRPVGVQPSGRIIVSTSRGFRRLLPSGAWDESFPAITSFRIDVDAQGYLYTRSASGPVQRLTPEGAPDPSSAYPQSTASNEYTLLQDGGLVINTILGPSRKLTWVRYDGTISGEATYAFSRSTHHTVALPDGSMLVIGDLNTSDINLLAARVYRFDSSGRQQFFADLRNDTMTLVGLVHDAIASGGVSGRAAVNLSGIAARGQALVTDREMMVLPPFTGLTGEADSYPFALYRARAAQDPVTSLAPTIFVQPVSRNAVPGSTATFTANAYGTYPRTYQWFKDGVAHGPARDSTSINDILSLPRTQPSDEGLYSMQIVTAHGSATSQPARLGTLAPPAVAILGPTALVVAPGQTVVLTLRTTGDSLSYFFQKDGRTYLDPNDPGYRTAGGTYSLVLPRITAADAGTYRIGVSNGALSVNSGDIVVQVSATAAPSRLINLSMRAQAGAGDESLIVGFVVAGAGTPPPLLARGIGPALTAFGVAGALADPQLTLRTGSTLVAANDNWAGDAQVAAAAVATGAFALADAASRDAALYVPALAPGAYTVQISGAAGTSGAALAEVYDAGPTGPRPSLVNLSARSTVASGGDPLIAGFTIAGGVAKTVLVRAIGPSLAAFGVADHVTRGELALYDSAGRKVAENLARGLDLAAAALAQQVGAFALRPDAADNALAITLPPGSYTAQFRSADAARRVALIEVYEVP